MAIDGATYEQIGDKFNVSRQRVHQILDARRVPPAERRAVVEDDLAPYFAQPLEPRCCRCSAVMASGHAPLCGPCRQLVRSVRRIKGLLRAARRGFPQALRQAHYEIGRSGIQPDDLAKA